MLKTSMHRRFKKLCDRYGYKIVPVMTRVNGMLTKRPDIVAVEKYHEWVATVPTEMPAERMHGHTDLNGIPHPSFFECEQKIYNDRFYGAQQV